LDEVAEVWEAVTSLFRDYGYRRLRAKARLKFLIKDWGIEKFREVLETEYLRRKLIDGPAPEPLTRPIDHVGVQRLKNGLNAVGVAPIAGRVSGTILSAVADLAEQAGSQRVSFTPYQKLIILDVPDDKLQELTAGLDALGLPSRPSHWRRNLMACTGIEYCKLSFAETRVRSQTLVPELERRLEDLNARLDVPVTVNINGCPNSCARIQIADIGFKGQMVDDGDGGSVEGFQVHLGGSLGLDSGFGRKLRQHKVTSDELGSALNGSAHGLSPWKPCRLNGLASRLWTHHPRPHRTHVIAGLHVARLHVGAAVLLFVGHRRMAHLHVHVLAPVQEEAGEENSADDEQSAGDDAHPRQRLVQAARPGRVCGNWIVGCIGHGEPPVLD
jgi:dissimilatory sulfite reductase (desulfoviridin) alpha/beta subunit